MIKKFILILLLLLFSSYIQEYPLNKKGKPTSNGINYYIKINEQNFINEYQKFINDTIYDIYIYTENLRNYSDYDSLELGRFYLPNEIIITNEEKFIGYELSKTKRRLNETNQFVKATLFHELTHVYYYQIILEMHMKNLFVSPEYNNLRMFPKSEMGFGSEFIEEGVCEYLIQKIGEIVPYKNIFIPKNIEELLDKKNRYDVKYKYASYFLKDFLDLTGLKKGIEILLRNKPPTYEEILNSNLFFNRLK
jgi:hypothetical protein